MYCCIRLLYFLIFQDPGDDKVLLSGYGVELAIKSTEYKAMDDSSVAGKSSTTISLVSPLFLSIYPSNFDF